MLAFTVGLLAMDAHAANPKNPTAEAKTLARDGLKLARGKNFKSAAQRFEAAFRLDPRAIYAHNLARSLEELGELTKAFDFFSQALRLDGEYTYAAEGRRKIGVLENRLKKTHGRVRITSTPAEVSLTLVETGGIKTQHLRSPHLRWVKPGPLTIQADKLGFEESIKVIEITLGRTIAVTVTLKPIPKKGYLDVSSNQDGAQVSVDGKTIGRAPIKGMLLEAGNHRVTIHHEGKTILERDIVIVPDKTFTVSHNLSELDLNQPNHDWLPTSLWITGGVLCAASIGLHIAAADRIGSVVDYPIFDLATVDPNRQDYDSVITSLNAQNAANTQQAKDATSTGQGLEVAAWIGYGLAVSSALVGTLLYLQNADNAPQSTSKAVPSLTLLPTVSVGADRSTFGLSMNF